MRITSAAAFNEDTDVKSLARIASSFWADIYDSEDIYALMFAFQHAYRQQLRELWQSYAKLGYTTIPLSHTTTYLPLLVNPADVKRSVVRFGEGFLFSDLPQIHFGDKHPDWWQFPKPRAIIDACLITDHPYRGKYWGIPGLQVEWEPEIIRMRQDPNQIFETITDHRGDSKLLVWCYMAQQDRRSMSRHFGPLINTQRSSSPSYLASARAVLDSYLYGGSELILRNLLASFTGESVPQHQETVQIVDDAYTHPVVITDRERYLGAAGCDVSVNVGDQVQPGTFLFDTIQFTDFSEVPAWLDYVDIPSSITGVPTKRVDAGTFSPLVAARDDGLKYIRFDSDDAFWRWFGSDPQTTETILRHLNVPIVSNASLATQQLPTDVDVLSLLSRVYFRYGLSLSRIRVGLDSVQDQNLFKLVREVCPPWTHHLIQLDTDAGIDDCQQIRSELPLL